VENALALALARDAFAGITRHDGSPYLGHLTRVADRLPERLKAAGLLHDIIEDTPATVASLVAAGISPRTAEIVEIVSRLETETYKEFIERIALDPDAVTVKLADLADNMTDGGGLGGRLMVRYKAAVDRLAPAVHVDRAETP